MTKFKLGLHLKRQVPNAQLDKINQGNSQK